MRRRFGKPDAFFKRRVRKLIVSLKRHTHYIPLLMLVVCCMIYTFQLTAHSNASMYVSSRIIALYVFVITLTSMLTVFSFMNAYGKRQKHKGLMLVVVYALIGVQLLLDGLYLDIIHTETMLRETPVPLTADIVASRNWTAIHFGALAAALILIVIMPVYRKMLLKIDTVTDDDEFAEILESEDKLVDDEGDYA